MEMEHTKSVYVVGSSLVAMIFQIKKKHTEIGRKMVANGFQNTQNQAMNGMHRNKLNKLKNKKSYNFQDLNLVNYFRIIKSKG